MGNELLVVPRAYRDDVLQKVNHLHAVAPVAVVKVETVGLRLDPDRVRLHAVFQDELGMWERKGVNVLRLVLGDFRTVNRQSCTLLHFRGGKTCVTALHHTGINPQLDLGSANKRAPVPGKETCVCVPLSA